MAGTLLKSVWRWGFLVLCVWTLQPDARVGAQSASCADNPNYGLKMATRGLRGDSQVFVNCQQTGIRSPSAGSAASSSADQALQGMAGSAAQNGANAINAMQQATQGLGYNSGTRRPSQGYNPINTLGRASLEDPVDSPCNCYLTPAQRQRGLRCDCNTSGAIGSPYQGPGQAGSAPDTGGSPYLAPGQAAPNSNTIGSAYSPESGMNAPAPAVTNSPEPTLAPPDGTDDNGHTPDQVFSTPTGQGQPDQNDSDPGLDATE